MLLLFLLILRATRVAAKIERLHDGFQGDFSVVNQGRMHAHTVLMFLQNKDLSDCIEFCIKHRRCVTVSYRSSTRECELNDMEFDEFEGDPLATEWINYSTPPMVHGGFSHWIEGACSGKGGPGVKIFYRLCDNPRPQHGGDSCKGKYEKTEICNLEPCAEDNMALGKFAFQSSTYNDEDKHAAKFGNDGDKLTDSVTKFETNPSWAVDLSQIIKIRMIRLYLSEYAFNKDRYNLLKISYRLKNSDKWSLCRLIAKATSTKVETTCEDEDTMAQYVSISLGERLDGGKNNLYLREVEIYKW